MAVDQGDEGDEDAARCHPDAGGGHGRAGAACRGGRARGRALHDRVCGQHWFHCAVAQVLASPLSSLPGILRRR